MTFHVSRIIEVTVLRTIFLYACAVFVFTLPLVAFPAIGHIAYACMLSLGLLLAIRQKSMFMDIEIILALAFVCVVFIGGVLHIDTFWEDKRGALWSCRVFLQVFSLLILFKFITLKYDEVVRFVVFPIVASSLLLLFIGLYKFYISHPSAFTYIDSSGALVSRFFIFENPNLSAIFATLSLGFILPFVQDPLRLRRYIVWIGVGALFLTLLYLGSRVGMLIFCVLCVSFVYLLSSFGKNIFSQKVKWGIMGGMLCVVALFFWVNIEVIMLKVLYGGEIRPVIYEVGIEHYLQSQYYWFGIGSGEFFKIDFTPFLGEEYKRIFHAHNLFLHFLIENGILGLLCYLGLWGCLIKRAFDKKRSGVYNVITLQAFWLVLIAHVIFSLSEATFFYRNAMWLVLLAVIALEVMPKGE